MAWLNLQRIRRQMTIFHSEKPKKKRGQRIKPLVLVKYKSEFASNYISLTLPVYTVSEGNCFEHWRKKHERHSAQRAQVRWALLPYCASIIGKCEVTLTRIAELKLDKHDNLPMSLKYVLDAVASQITGDFRPGRADNDERFTFLYGQESSSDNAKEYGVRIEIRYSLP